MHGLSYLVREGIACTKVVPRSRVLLCIYIDACLSLCWGVLLLAVIADFLFVCSCGVGCRVVERRRPWTTQGLPSLVAARGRLRVCPGLVPVPGPAFVELVLLLAGASVAPGSGCLVLPGLRRFPRRFGIWAVLLQFPELRGTRQVEIFAACSFRHLPQVVSHPGG